MHILPHLAHGYNPHIRWQQHQTGTAQELSWRSCGWSQQPCCALAAGQALHSCVGAHVTLIHQQSMANS